MRMRHTVLLVSAIALSLVAVGCATTGSTKAATPRANSVYVALLTPKQVQTEYGYNFSEDPFVPPGPTMGGLRYNFLVMRLTIRATSSAEFALLKASATNLNGQAKAAYLNRSEFAQYLKRLETRPGPSETLRLDKVGWYYLPADRFQVERGEKSYVIVFVGEAPIGNSVTINLQASLAGKIYDFSVAVPPSQAY